MPLLTNFTPRRAVLIGTLAIAGVALLWAVTPEVGNLAFSNQHDCGYDQIAGTWAVGSLNPDGKVTKATMVLDQKGHGFTGKGLDEFGQFTIVNGKVDGTQVSFTKDYSVGGAKGVQASYTGAIDWWNPNPNEAATVPFLVHAFGGFSQNRRLGYGWHTHVVTETGKWEAGLLVRPDGI
jgi:hypothetical protein